MLNILSALVTVAGSIPYIVSILRGHTRPDRATWWIWFFMSFIVASTYYSIGARAALGMALGGVCTTAAIALLTIRYGLPGFQLTDILCLIGAFFTAFIWFLLSSAYIPHLFILLIDFFGFIPTLRKTVADPSSENFFAWLLWAAAAVVSLLNVQTWSVWEILFPTYIFFADGSIALLVAVHSLRVRQKPGR